MPSQDCLIWIGDTYKTVAKYLTEAESRGCCREVPMWPPWAKPGKTRIFLAHRDGHAGCDRGAVFGYFVLHGVDIVLTQRDCEEYKKLAAEHLKTPRGKTDASSLKRFWKTAKGKVNAERLLDFWRTRSRGNPLPFTMPHRSGGSRLENGVMDFLLDFLISCESKGHGGYGISTDQTSLEEARYCGVRLGPEGTQVLTTDDPDREVEPKSTNPHNPLSVYFVDQLTRTVDEFFCEFLKEVIKKASEKSKSRSRSSVIGDLRRIAKKERKPRYQRGIPEFQKALRKAATRRTAWLKLPPDLNTCARVRGAMVVFNGPYPFFQRIPRADFKGLIEIDGDELVRRIKRVYSRKTKDRKIVLPYYDTRRASHAKSTKEQLNIRLAQKLQTTLTFADTVANGFAELVLSELRTKQTVTLHDIGTLKVKRKKQRAVLEFNASDALKRHL